ncbi:MAG: macro domain-containing protein [Microscillaceae bacterium]|nr:macro domain-containing protein [Microscillaceae bacterium]
MLIHPKIEIVQGNMFDLVAQKQDAIVNPTDEDFSGLGPLDSLIHQKAGSSLKEELTKIKNCKYGDAVITKGYNLSFQFIIHTINPSWLISKDKKFVKRLLETCYENCLQIAEENQVKRIIFPPLSTGNRAFPFFIAADIAVSKVSSYLDENLNSNIQEAVFVANSDEVYKSFIIRDIQEQRDYLDQQYRNLRSKKLLFEKGIQMIKDTVRENQEKNKMLEEKNEILNDISIRLKKQTNIAVHERDIQRLKTRELEKMTNELTEKNQLINLQKDELFEKTQELEAIAEELRQQNEVVEQKNIELQSLQSTKDLMISAINHDLRNPLNPIINYSSPSFPNPDKEKLLQKIHFRSKRMKAMVEEVMYIYQADKLELQTSTNQLRKTVQSAITLIADFQSQMPEIRNEVPENIYGQYNEDYIRRVIENLLVNAIKYSNGVDMPLIVLSAETQGEQLKLRIRDNGWGIAPDKLKALQEGVTQFETKQDTGEKSIVLIFN